MEKVTTLKTAVEDIHAYYMMNGQVIFANFIGMDEDTDDYIVERPVMVMIGQGKQIAMSTAYPFSNIDDKIRLNWHHVTTSSSLEWNEQLTKEYGNFWQQIRAKAAGIVMAGPSGMPKGPMGPRK